MFGKKYVPNVKMLRLAVIIQRNIASNWQVIPYTSASNMRASEPHTVCYFTCVVTGYPSNLIKIRLIKIFIVIRTFYY